MFYYVYLDPEVFLEADKMEKGQELLLGVFDQLRDSCFFVGNQQWEWEAEIRAALEKIQTDDYEIEYKKHLQFIKTNNRLLHTLPIVDILDISEVLQNSHEIGGIDLVITNRPSNSEILPEDTEIVEFDKFRKSQFSKTLRDMPSDGVKDLRSANTITLKNFMMSSMKSHFDTQKSLRFVTNFWANSGRKQTMEPT